MVAERKIKVGEVSCNKQDLLFDVELGQSMPANSGTRKSLWVKSVARISS
jgi:hypothetical protein